MRFEVMAVVLTEDKFMGCGVVSTDVAVGPVDIIFNTKRWTA